MDSKFRQLVKNTKTQMDKDVQFLLDHGIDPSAKYSNIPMYYPDKDCLVILRGPAKGSPYFTNKNVISSGDRVVVQEVKEERIPSTPEQPHNNFYTKDYGEKFELTVDEYKSKIYDNPANDETKTFFHLKDLDTTDEISNAQSTYDTNRKNNIDHRNYEFNEWIKRYGYEFEDQLEGLTDPQKTLALQRLYKKSEEGYDIEDLAKSNIIWQVRHQNVFKLAQDVIKNTKDNDLRDKLKNDFARKQHEWFKQGLNTTVELLVAVKEWLNGDKAKEESVLTELYPSNQSKAMPLKDLYEIKKVLVKLFGIDADRFITVPVIKNAVYTQDKNGNKHLEHPEERLKVISFPDQSEINRLVTLLDKQDKTPEELAELGKLSNYSMVRVQDVASPNKETFLMNLKDLGDLIKQPQNHTDPGNQYRSIRDRQSELDTVDFRLHSGNAIKTLNPGMGTFEGNDLPDEVVLKMLDTVKNEHWEYDDIDLAKYYNASKRVGKANPLVTKALNQYNKGYENYIIRAFSKGNSFVYKGFTPYPENPHSKPSIGGKDKYKQMMK